MALASGNVPPRCPSPQGLHIKSTNSIFRPYGTAIARLGLRFLPTFRPYGTAVTYIRVFGQTLGIMYDIHIKYSISNFF
ncbi:MAG: hypothetical protein LBD59_10995 [Prevotellaceae bacterium]|nr:hypothetical protein [Prevotellaceae bacterium]